MTEVGKLKKEVCKCHNPECGKVFKSKDIKHTYIESYGLKIHKGVCPHCESNTYGYGLLVYPVSEESLIYGNSNFPSELVKHLDQITDDIIKEDLLKYKQRKVIKKINEERMAMA